MLKEILLTDDERDGILGLCQYTLNRVRETLPHSPMIRKSACARLGLIICKVKGHVPHYNEAYIAEKGGWKREEPIFTCPRNTVTLTKDRYEFRKGDKWHKRVGTATKPGTSPV